jgi:hypothetical protein
MLSLSPNTATTAQHTGSGSDSVRHAEKMLWVKWLKMRVTTASTNSAK